LIDLSLSYNYIANFYEQLFPNFQRVGSIWEKRLSDFFQLGSNNLIVDIGCGIGIQSVALAKRGFDVFAIDFSDQMIKRGCELSKKHNQKVTFIQGDCREINSLLPNDLLFTGFLSCGSVILHLSIGDIKMLANQIYKFLDKGGKGIIEFFNWSIVESEALKWTPRNHFRNEKVEQFSIEFFYQKNKQVLSSILFFTI